MATGLPPLPVAFIITPSFSTSRRPPRPARLFIFPTAVISRASVSVRPRFVGRAFAVTQLRRTAAGVASVPSTSASSRRFRPIVCPGITVACIGSTVRISSVCRCPFAIVLFLFHGRISPAVTFRRDALAASIFVLAFARRAFPRKFMLRRKRRSCGRAGRRFFCRRRSLRLWLPLAVIQTTLLRLGDRIPVTTCFRSLGSVGNGTSRAKRHG